MNLLSLKLKNFKKFKSKELEFVPGLNIVYGQNESGKSTISKALMTGFFADPSTRARKFFGEVKNWDETAKNTSVSNLPKIEITFEAGGKEYYLLKDFQNRVALIESRDGSETYEGISSVESFVYKLFGFTSESVYQSTGFIKHEQLSGISKSHDFYSAVQSASAQLDTSENLHELIDNLDKEIADLQRGLKNPAKNSGPIKRNIDKKRELEYRLEEMKNKQSRVAATLKNKSDATNKIEELKFKLEKLENLIENNRKYQTAKSEFRVITQKLESIQNLILQVEDMDTEIAKNNVKIEKYARISGVDLDALILEIKQIESDIATRQELLNNLKSELALISQRLVLIKKDITAYVAIVFIVLGILIAVITRIYWIGIVPFTGGIVLLSWQLYMRFMSRLVRKEKELQASLAEMEELQKNSKTKLDVVLDKYDFNSVEEIYNAKTEMISYANNIQTYTIQKAKLLAGKQIHEWRHEQTRLFLQKKELELNKFTQDIKDAKLEEDELLAKKRELDLTKQELESQQKLLYTSDADIKAASISESELQGVEENLESVAAELEYFQKRLQILEKTKVFLTKAADDTVSMVSEVLKRDIEKYLPIITDHKYEKVKFDNELEIQVFESNYKKWIKPENNLSSGATDQIFFLIRLAFFKLLLKKGALFLVLDDPFVNYDEKRLANTLEILKQEQLDYQILLFTNNKGIESGNVIRI